MHHIVFGKTVTLLWDEVNKQECVRGINQMNEVERMNAQNGNVIRGPSPSQLPGCSQYTLSNCRILWSILRHFIIIEFVKKKLKIRSILNKSFVILNVKN